MANNRMYLVNKRSGQRVYLAKFYPSTGWYPVSDRLSDQLAEAFDKSDFGHLTPEQRQANVNHQGLGVPHKASGGTYGERWDVEYEEEPVAPVAVKPTEGEGE